MVLVVVTLLAGVGIIALMQYNALVTKRVLTIQSFSRLRTQLEERRRIVREALTQELIASTRGTLMAELSEPIAENCEDDSCVEELIGNLCEALESNDKDAEVVAMKAMVASIDKISERVSFFREAYHDAVAEYNHRVSSFPGRLIASLAGFRRKEIHPAHSDRMPA